MVIHHNGHMVILNQEIVVKYVYLSGLNTVCVKQQYYNRWALKIR